LPAFCATLAAQPENEISSLGGIVSFHARRCGLGLVATERPGTPAGYFEVASSNLKLAACGSVTLFNRSALAEKLSQEFGQDVRNNPDGELLLRVYERAGLPGLSKLNGMFGLAIWDGSSLALISDPVGSRSIFYARAGDTWLASASLRVLRHWPRLNIQPDLAAARAFLVFAYVPGELTLLEGVRRVPPGCRLRLFPDGHSEIERYWEPVEGSWDPTDPPEAYALRLGNLLEDAVQTRLPAGQPVGVFLSGGLDSSLITALAAKLHDQPVHTYTINFGKKYPNELPYAAQVAKHCATPHHILTYSGEEIASCFTATISHMDLPVGEGLTVPNLMLARAAAQDGLHTVLNGEGGDPCFGGPKNIPMLAFEIHRKSPAPEERARAYLRSYRHCYDELPRLLSPKVQDMLRSAPSLEELVLPGLHDPSMRFYLNRLMAVNLRLKGAGYMLPKVEALTALMGLEARAPLFDRRIVEFSFSVPPQYKLAGTNEKWVLKLAVRDLLPRSIIKRPKSGMRMPMQDWLHGPLHHLSRKILLHPTSRQREFFQLDTIQTWLRGDGLLWPRHGVHLWLVLTLETWFRTYIDRTEPESIPYKYFDSLAFQSSRPLT
jgi:asparagine synthase (glutamine-hydrolysing)